MDLRHDSEVQQQDTNEAAPQTESEGVSRRAFMGVAALAGAGFATAGALA